MGRHAYIIDVTLTQGIQHGGPHHKGIIKISHALTHFTISKTTEANEIKTKIITN